MILKDKSEKHSMTIRLGIWEAWIFGGVGLAFTLITIALEITIPELPQHYQIFIIVVSIISYAILTIFVYRYYKKELPVDKSSYSILPEYRNKYHDHVEGLFNEVKKNLSPIMANDGNYFDALRQTNDKKRMIFQHLRTMDSFSDSYSSMFAMYKISVTELNDIEKRKKQILREVEDYDEKLDGYAFGNYEDDWIDKNDFKIAIGIKRNDSMEDILKDEPLYAFPSSINCRLYLKPENGKFKLGYAGHWFAKCKDKKRLEQFQDFIYKEGHKLMQDISSIHNTYGTVYNITVPFFNKEFKEHYETLEGDPVLGACTSCQDWFDAKSGKKYKMVLNEFNSNLSNYEETIWQKETQFD